MRQQMPAAVVYDGYGTKAMTKSQRSLGSELSQPGSRSRCRCRIPGSPGRSSLPPPRPFESRPDPLALRPPVETLTLTWPDGATRPEALTASATQIGDRAAANHHPVPVGWVAGSARRGDEVTLQGPSNDAAYAAGAEETPAIAKVVAIMTARMEWLIIGTLVLASSGLLAPAPRSRAPGRGRCAFFFNVGKAMVGLSSPPGRNG